jgi:Sulfotransferase domain
MDEDAETPDSPGRRPKVFGLGLSRTGTKSLTVALHLLGFDVVHYPTDETSFAAMVRGAGRFPILDRYDGLTDIVTIPFIAELDALLPGSRFILTVREREDWLCSMENHWRGKTVTVLGREVTTAMCVRSFLRAAVFGCYEFNRERLSRVYDDHFARVHSYFRDRPEDLLVLDIIGGEGWDRLAPFLGCVPPDVPFPCAPTQVAMEEQYPKSRSC